MSDHAAQITFQSYFRLYKKLAGMTGTAAQNRWEIRRVYKIWVVCVPTNQPIVREHWRDRVFADGGREVHGGGAGGLAAAGAGAVGADRHAVGGQVGEAERKLREAGVDHQVLNARQHDKEAAVVAEAGGTGKVTIATNMAGRGTDIKPDRVCIEAGGLHVLGTERHEALRIDRQLMGRAGRQGDPGSAQFYVSLEDELLEGLGEKRQESLKERGRRGGARDWNDFQPLFQLAQEKVEHRHYRNRVDLMVHEKQRQEILKDLGADPYVD